MPLGLARVGFTGGGAFSPVVATGGTTSTYTDGGVEYKSHTFTGGGTFSVSDTGSEGEVQFMALAGGASGGGGGGGGSDGGGGGGAGGMLGETLKIGRAHV